MVRPVVDFLYSQAHPSVSFLALTYLNFVVAVISARPLWLKTVRVASASCLRGKYATPCAPWHPWRNSPDDGRLGTDNSRMGYYETDGDGAQVGLTLSSGPLLRQLVSNPIAIEGCSIRY